jgi:hypothetical protein
MIYGCTFELCFKPLPLCISMGSSIETLSRRMEYPSSATPTKANCPRNFLYDVDRGQGVLVDFGLAEVPVMSSLPLNAMD